MLTLAWGERTHAGLVRSRNEDAMLAAPPLFAVADGMGGHAAGDVASALTVKALARLAESGSPTRTDVLDAIRAVDADIFSRSSEDTAGMGTTVCGLAVTSSPNGPERLVVFNVGDSRAYRLREGLFAQLTQDHSIVQELMDDGRISPIEAKTHPDRNVITRSLGTGHHLDIDWWTLDPEVGDRYLLTSDGLTRELDVSDIGEVIGAAATPALAAERLVERALSAGARDNITVVVVEVISTESPDVEQAIIAPTFEDPLDADTSPRRATIGFAWPIDDRLETSGVDADTNPVPRASTNAATFDPPMTVVAPTGAQP